MLDALSLMQADEDIKGAIKVKDRECTHSLGRANPAVTKSKSIGKLKHT